MIVLRDDTAPDIVHIEALDGVPRISRGPALKLDRGAIMDSYEMNGS